MTERYETCTPDIVHCPDNICDELEHLDPRICPQDCTIECNIFYFYFNYSIFFFFLFFLFILIEKRFQRSFIISNCTCNASSFLKDYLYLFSDDKKKNTHFVQSIKRLVIYFLAEVHFGEMNRGGRGIKSGLGTCSCNDMMQCTCGPVSFRKTGSDGVDESSGGADGVGNKDSTRMKKERQKEVVVSDAHKGLRKVSS